MGSLLLTRFTSVSAQQADAIKGVCVNTDKDLKMEFSQTGSVFNGRIVWSANMYDADGKTLKKDVNNERQELKSRPILDRVIFSGLSYSDGQWTGGGLYDPGGGKTYKCKIRLKSGVLQIRGYAGIFGKTTEWTRN